MTLINNWGNTMRGSLTHSLTHWKLKTCSAVLITCTAASSQGSWSTPFDHEHASIIATDAEFVFGVNGPNWHYRTGATGIVATFNALHMSLIPVGSHRGRVLVWDGGETVGEAAPFAPAGQFWNFQRYSIVDPITPTGTRFYNYFLPIEPWTFPLSVFDLFCAGHAWSPFGYLVVAGGTEQTPADLGAKLLFTFDPRFDNAPFGGGAGPSLYPNATGTRWDRAGFDLNVDRYYPTTTLARRFPRTVPNQPSLPPTLETMLVMGGVKDANLPHGQAAENTYEALILTDALIPTATRLFRDQISNESEWWGPGIPSGTPTDSWFLLYPRAHYLSNGRVFVAGDAPISAQIDHSFLPATTTPEPTANSWVQRWDTAAGTPGPASEHREACSTVFFARIGTLTDVVVRIGGESATTGALNTTETCLATTAGAWLPSPAFPNLQIAREHANAVILPDGSVFVVGGNDSANVAVSTPELLKWGNSQGILQPNLQSPRGYHSAAVLLPDGSVLVGGADARHPTASTGFDYERYLPPYMTGSPAPVRPTNLSIPIPSYIDIYNTSVLQRSPGGSQPYFTVIADDTGDAPLLFKITQVVLVTPGSVTHHSDMHQRFFQCPVISNGSYALQFQLPSEDQMPRGYHMMFVLSSTGIPSHALWVSLQ